MARFEYLPNELLLQVAYFAVAWRDLAALSGADRRCHKLVGDLVLRKLTQMGLGTVYLFWMVDAQVAGAVRQILRCGIDPNQLVEPKNTPMGVLQLDDSHHAAASASIPAQLSYRRAAGNIVRNSGLLLYEMEACLGEPEDSAELSEPRKLREYRQGRQCRLLSALHTAAQGGDVDIIADLLRHGAHRDLMYLDPRGGPAMAPRTFLSGSQHHSRLPSRVRPRVEYSPLHCAIFSSNTQAAKHLLEAGASLKSCIPIDDPKESGWMVPSTPLHLASFMGSLDLVKYLVESGYQADINAKDDSGVTPLVYAVVGGDLQSTGRYLLEKGADSNALVSPGCSLLLQSCWHGNFQDALILLDHGAEVGPEGSTPNSSMSPLHACCIGTTNTWRVNCSPNYGLVQSPSQGDYRLQVVERLLRLGVSANRRSYVQGFGTSTPLQLASDSCFVDIVERLVNYGGDVEARNDNGDTALLLAISGHGDATSKFDTVSYLLGQGCNVNEPNAQGESPLHLLGSWCNSIGQPPLDFRHKDILLRRLLDLGADIHARTTQQNPVSVFRAFFKLGSYECCKLLADRGAATSLGPDEFVAIFKACVQKRPKVYLDMDANNLLELLLRVDSTNSILGNPENLEYALVKGDMKTALSLLERGCLCGKDREHRTALHRACWIGAVEVVTLLLDCGLDVNEPFSSQAEEELNGRTPIQFAMEYAATHYGAHPSQDRKGNLLQLLVARGASIRSPLIAKPLILDLIHHNQVALLDTIFGDHSTQLAELDPEDYLEFVAAACDSTERLCNPHVIRVLLRHALSLPPPAAAPSPPRPRSRDSGSGSSSGSERRGAAQHGDFLTRFRRRYGRGPLELLVTRYRPLEMCPHEDCDCGANLLRSILVVVLALEKNSNDVAATTTTSTPTSGKPNSSTTTTTLDPHAAAGSAVVDGPLLHHHQLLAPTHGDVHARDLDYAFSDRYYTLFSAGAQRLLSSGPWRPRLAGIFRDATLQMGSYVAGTSPGGMGRSTRHCLEFVMGRLGLTSAELRHVSTRSSFFNSII